MHYRTLPGRTSVFAWATALLLLAVPGVSTATVEWSVVRPPTYQVASVWGSSGTDVFAVGDKGTILHYDGDSWDPMNSGTQAELKGVWGSGAGDVFAAGYIGSSGAGVIVHYDGNSWTPMNCGATGRLTGVWGTSATDVFALDTAASAGRA